MSILDKVASIKTVIAVIDNVIHVLLKCLDVILDKGSSKDVA